MPSRHSGMRVEAGPLRFDFHETAVHVGARQRSQCNSTDSLPSAGVVAHGSYTAFSQSTCDRERNLATIVVQRNLINAEGLAKRYDELWEIQSRDASSGSADTIVTTTNADVEPISVFTQWDPGVLRLLPRLDATTEFADTCAGATAADCFIEEVHTYVPFSARHGGIERIVNASLHRFDGAGDHEAIALPSPSGATPRVPSP
jgi:hypothetical protein